MLHCESSKAFCACSPDINRTFSTLMISLRGGNERAGHLSYEIVSNPTETTSASCECPVKKVLQKKSKGDDKIVRKAA